MANVQKKYNKANNAYSENNSVTNARNTLASLAKNTPMYTNSYANQLNDIYGRIKSGKDFNYNPDNDLAYRKYAEEYNALSGLAIAGNQAQAQGLTGGYGSTYAPEVANQGLARLQENAANAQPLFYQMAQNAYMAENDALMNQYQAAAAARNDELENYGRRADAYNNQYALAAQRYGDERDFDYTKYGDNRNFWASRYDSSNEQSNFNKELTLKKYDVYNNLAANKCADYNSAGNNKGMRAYLDKLVKQGKLTQYMADNLYKKYEYTPPKTTTTTRTSSTRNSSSNSQTSGSGTNKSGNAKTTGKKANWFPTAQQINALGFGSISNNRFWELYEMGYINMNPDQKKVWVTSEGKAYKQKQNNKPSAFPNTKNVKSVSTPFWRK